MGRRSRAVDPAPVDGLDARVAMASSSALLGSHGAPRPCSDALRLFAALEREGIRYCHWKSNIRLDRTLVGLEDIDVLVHPADADAFQRVIGACGFKLTVSRIGAGHPGVFHALAWDFGRWPPARPPRLSSARQRRQFREVLPLPDRGGAARADDIPDERPHPRPFVRTGAVPAQDLAQAHQRDRDHQGERALRGMHGRAGVATAAQRHQRRPQHCAIGGSRPSAFLSSR